MIGKEVRGIHHLSRLIKADYRYPAFLLLDTSYIYCQIIKANKYILIFNNNIGQKTRDIYIESTFTHRTLENIDFLKNAYSCVLVKKLNCSPNEMANNIGNILLLPIDFEEQYYKFCSENKKNVEVAERKYCPMTQDIPKYLYALCNASKNYFFWAIAEVFNHSINLSVIKQIMVWAENYNQLIKNLSLGTITAYKNHDQILMVLRNEMRQLRNEKRINDVINSFNTAQKKLLKNKELSDRDKITLAKFGKISKAKKINFIRKMSTIDDVDEILKQMAYLVNVHFVWDKKAFIDYVTHTDNLHAEIIMENGPIVLVKVDDYDAVKYLGKNTNWCISKNKTYWNQYTMSGGKAIQYMIFDFSKKEDDVKSIIGFTSKINVGIVHAHDFCNNNLMGNNNEYEIPSDLEPFVTFVSNGNNIFNIIKKDGINLNDVTFFDNLPFEWNKKEFLHFLNVNVGLSDYEILVDNGDKMAISFKNCSQLFLKLFGDKYSNTIGSDYWDNEHFMFLDFNQSKNNPKKLLFGIVYDDDVTYESSVGTIYDEHANPTTENFDALLTKYNLPYDIICRTNNIYNRFLSALSTLSVSVIRALFEDNKSEMRNIIIDGKLSGTIYRAIDSSLLRYYSFSIIKIFYDNGYKLFDVLGKKYFMNFMHIVLQTLLSYKRNNYAYLVNPVDRDIAKFNAKNLNDINDCKYIGLALSFYEIFKHEDNIRLASFLMEVICQNNDTAMSSLFDHLINIVFKKENFSNINSLIANLINYVMRHNIKEAKDCILEKSHSNDKVAHLIRSV